jgi:thiamine-phosphate pyrophosphorylase
VKPLADCLLYAFVDTAYLNGRSPQDIARQLCDGGADLIQFRAKTWTPDQIRSVAEELLSITTNAGVGLVINDYPGIAAEVGAPFCHLGQEDFFDAGYCHVHQILRVERHVAVGLSTHAPAQAERALAAGAAYIAIGPVFPTGTKPGVAPVTLEYVRWAAGHVSVPWFAIGGVSLQTLDAVLAAGARRICAVSAILNAPNPRQACQTFKDRLLSAGREQKHP